MKAIAGVLTFDGGELCCCGQSLISDAACEARPRRGLGLMPQAWRQNLYADLSVKKTGFCPPPPGAARRRRRAAKVQHWK